MSSNSFPCQLYQHGPCCKVNQNCSLGQHILQFTAVLQKYVYLQMLFMEFFYLSHRRGQIQVCGISHLAGSSSLCPSIQANERIIYESNSQYVGFALFTAVDNSNIPKERGLSLLQDRAGAAGTGCMCFSSLATRLQECWFSSQTPCR